MRIAIDTQSTLGQKTGIGTYTTELTCALRRIAPENEYLEINWGVDKTMRLDHRLIWQQFELPVRTRQSRCDLLHVTGFDAPFWKPCPVILTVHDLIGILYPGNFPPVSRFYWSWWLPKSIRWADKIITDSSNSKRDLINLLNIPQNRIDVIYPGINSAIIPMLDHRKLDDIRQKYSLPNNYLLFTGTIEPRKGLDTLINAFASVLKKYPHTLIICGKMGWRTESLWQQISRNDFKGRIRYLGYINDEDLSGIYQLAELFIFPSKYEGFGFPPLEAMTCGTPVICSNTSSLPEVVDEAGLMIEPDNARVLADAIMTCLEDNSMRDRMKQKGIERAKLFNWDETARKVLNLYECTV